MKCTMQLLHIDAVALCSGQMWGWFGQRCKWQDNQKRGTKEETWRKKTEVASLWPAEFLCQEDVGKKEVREGKAKDVKENAEAWHIKDSQSISWQVNEKARDRLPGCSAKGLRRVLEGTLPMLRRQNTGRDAWCSIAKLAAKLAVDKCR